MVIWTICLPFLNLHDGFLAEILIHSLDAAYLGPGARNGIVFFMLWVRSIW